MCCSLKCGSLHLVSRSSLNMLWIIHPSRSSSWNTFRPMFFEILKDLYLFWSSFFKGLFKWIFLFSNHMLSPTFNPWGFLCFLLNCFFIISCTAFIDFVVLSQLSYRLVRKSSNFGNSVCTTRLPFHRCLPKLSSNGVRLVTICFLLLYWNSAAARYSFQLSCW